MHVLSNIYNAIIENKSFHFIFNRVSQILNRGLLCWCYHAHSCTAGCSGGKQVSTLTQLQDI